MCHKGWYIDISLLASVFACRGQFCFQWCDKLYKLVGNSLWKKSPQIDSRILSIVSKKKKGRLWKKRVNNKWSNYNLDLGLLLSVNTDLNSLLCHNLLAPLPLPLKDACFLTPLCELMAFLKMAALGAYYLMNNDANYAHLFTFSRHPSGFPRGRWYTSHATDEEKWDLKKYLFPFRSQCKKVWFWDSNPILWGPKIS